MHATKDYFVTKDIFLNINLGINISMKLKLIIIFYLRFVGMIINNF